MDIRVSHAQFGTESPVVNVSWAQFNPLSSTVNVCVSWCQFNAVDLSSGVLEWIPIARRRGRR